MRTPASETGFRMRHRGLPGAAAALAATVMLTLAGCAGLSGAPASVALTEQPGFPADAPISEPLFDENWRGEPVGWLADDRATVTIISYWSSSCPLIATAIEVLDESTIAIELRTAPAQACTDDLAPHTHVLATPEGWGTGDGPYTAEVTRVDTGFGEVVTPVELWPWPEPATIAVQTLREVPADITLPPDALDRGEPLAYWGAERQSLRVITWGSSSCPPPATFIGTVGTTELELVFGPLPAGRVCTAVFGPTTHVLGVPDGLDAGPITLAVRFDERDGSAQRFRIPISD
ncbi:MAG: hypothetical protein LDL15_08165 [Yonghaparkia sp.]|nr:hypothetical protein [Microcella sp.]